MMMEYDHDEDNESDYMCDDDFNEEEQEGMIDDGTTSMIREADSNSNSRNNQMELSPEEKQRAIALKQAMIASAADDELSLCPLPDMEVAHVAIIRSQSLELALDTIYKMQCFREELQILDTPEDGVATIGAFMTLQPGFLLDLSYLPSEGTYTWSCDYACLNPSAVKTQADWRTFQGGFYYMMRATVTDFQAVRTGLMTLSECEGMGLHNFDIKLFEKAVYEFWSFYPANYKETVWVNTPGPANMCYSLLKRLVTPELANSWRIGETINEGGRLNELFHMPNQKVAEDALLQRIARYLAERYKQEQTYRLVA